ncbi:uncharacterized protein LOC125678781 [Ostrea edulis]|uniref:uncharacterized protein LOC125678781 n=1 Tax=Ostrea edulis TaxID=37623 RepID=UPI0024AFC88D|nr:uncharacterized protein LOC125678781 [Ostrea edulis]
MTFSFWRNKSKVPLSFIYTYDVKSIHKMITEGQQSAIDLALSSHNLYIGGQAGTGKTFLLLEIYNLLKKQNKMVYITCTTGIACTNFNGFGANAQTIHSWSGIDDGRYELTKIQSVLENYKKETHSRICETDVLIVDEVSMLSQKQFELVEKACAVKNHNLLFGGIQVILSGDFYQLPPIRNLLYHDDGKFCFQSAIFQQAIPHRIVLDEVIRQNDPQFIKVVNEISVGKVSSDTEKFVKGLSGDFCSQTSDSLKLYATNDLVEQHNRDSIIRWPGEMFEYTSNDFGKLDSLHRILAPPVLWLKKECPVILLQNISGKLFNGLRGSVVSCDNDGPTVHFQSVNITRKLKKESFSVYSPDLKRNVVERVQIPLKLAFALTVHKAQGMTLNCVEVDRRKMFAPGKLGVAISRVRSATDLRVINFNANVCIPHPNIIPDFLQSPSCTPIDDFTCCRFHRQIVSDFEGETSIPLDILAVAMQSEFEDMEVCDDTVLNTLTVPTSDTPCSSDTFSLPADFSTTEMLRNLYVKNVVTDMQKETNDVLDILCSSGSVLKNVHKFCADEFSIMNDMIESIRAEKIPQAIKPDRLAEFYRTCHEHQTSTQYKARVLI